MVLRLTETAGQQSRRSQSSNQRNRFTVTTACGGYDGWIGDFIEERRLMA